MLSTRVLIQSQKRVTSGLTGSMIVTSYSLTWWKLNKACDHSRIAVYQLMNLGYAFKTSNYSFCKFFHFDLLLLMMFYNKSMHICYMNHSILLIKHKHTNYYLNVQYKFFAVTVIMGMNNIWLWVWDHKSIGLHFKSLCTCIFSMTDETKLLYLSNWF